MRACFILAVAVVAGCLLRTGDRFFSSNLTVIFFDVGQGDGALVQFPGGKTALIDAGGGFGDWNVGERLVIPELTRRAIISLDHIFLSHPDQDHAFGLLPILTEMPVGHFWFNAGFERDRPRHPLFGQLVQLADRFGVRRQGVTLPVRFSENGVDVQARVASLVGKKTNDRSLLLTMQFGGCTFLFTGDIEARSERRLISERLGPVTVLKIAHHGSKSSSIDTLVRQLDPKIGVISCGLSNPYGHPHSTTLNRFRRSETEIFRTDFHGFIQIVVEPSGRLSCTNAHGSCGEIDCPNNPPIAQ